MNKTPYAVLAAVLALSACGRLRDTDQVAQSAGDVLASLDESTLDGQIANRIPYQSSDRLEGNKAWTTVRDFVIAPAHAATCGLFNQFSTCTAGVRSKDFGSCTWNGLTFTGEVSLSFSDSAACSVDEAGESVTRSADFSIVNKAGNTLVVSSAGGGQKLTRQGPGAFKYTVLGMNRSYTDAEGEAQFDISTRTLEDINVTGTSRSNRVADGGKLEITHNLAGYVTELVPEQLTWDGSCNCPISGKLVGNTQGGSGKRAVNKDFLIEVTGCGKATVTVEGDVNDVEFDRCRAN
jgi:hypothetical protein